MSDSLITQVIAVYGACLSTVVCCLSILGSIPGVAVAWREYQKDKRQVEVIFEYVAWQERPQLTITNIGHRPVTISQVSATICFPDVNGNPFWDQVPANAFYDFELTKDLKQPLLPVTLADGQHISLPLSHHFGEPFFSKQPSVKFSVFDVEGHIYRQFKKRVLDVKWGGYHSSP